MHQNSSLTTIGRKAGNKDRIEIWFVNIIKDILLYYNNNQLRITTPSTSVHYILNIIYQIQFMIFCCFDGEDMRPKQMSNLFHKPLAPLFS